MRSLRALVCITALATAFATASCKPPNPIDVAGVALDLTIHGVDEAARAASQAGRAIPSATPVPPASTYTPGTYYPQGAYPGTYPVAVVPTPVPVVQTRFAGEDNESRWSVLAAGREVCATPCTLRYAAGTQIEMLQADVPRKPARLGVPYFSGGSYDVRARPRITGAFAPGVVAASFGGMGTLAGIPLTAVGCSQNNRTMCEGGLITFGASSAMLALGIVLVAISGPRITVESIFATNPASP
jgi:hypothetical protein